MMEENLQRILGELEEEDYLAHNMQSPSLDDKIPFLQMLQSVEATPFSSFMEPSFQMLLTLQHQQKMVEVDPESCLTTHLDSHSPGKWEKKEREWRFMRKENGQIESSNVVKKRKRNRNSRVMKDKEEVESQRMTHIAVERNRRRQMNDHLSALRSLMPPSYSQRGDQASIIGGAIDYVKELEQLLESLQAQNRIAKGDDTSPSDTTVMPFIPARYSLSGADQHLDRLVKLDEEMEGNNCRAEYKSSAGRVEVTMIQNHVNMKIKCGRKPGQLLTAIVGLEQLRLTVLHLSITSMGESTHYSFSLKIEDDCELQSADQIAGAIHQIFTFINAN